MYVFARTLHRERGSSTLKRERAGGWSAPATTFLPKNEVTAPGLMADAPPTVAMALCVGKYAVASHLRDPGGGDGTFEENVDLAEHSRTGGGYPLYKLLWESLGVSHEA